MIQGEGIQGEGIQGEGPGYLLLNLLLLLKMNFILEVTAVVGLNKSTGPHNLFKGGK